MFNYTKLIAYNPTVIAEFVNSIGQEIKIVEHPTLGDDYPLIAICDDLKLADGTDFMETEEITEIEGDYEVMFIEGHLRYGFKEYV